MPGDFRQEKIDGEFSFLKRSSGSQSWLPSAIGQVYQNSDSDWPFDMADFRAYDRALSDEKIAELSQ